MKYEQVCPVSMASEVIAERWTPLILREIVLFDRHHFTEIQHGVGRISQSLLSQRLRTLEDAGVIERRPNPDAPRPETVHPRDNGTTSAAMADEMNGTNALPTTGVGVPLGGRDTPTYSGGTTNGTRSEPERDSERDTSERDSLHAHDRDNEPRSRKPYDAVSKMTEDQLQAAVMDLAGVFRWRRAHFRAALTSRGHRTAVSGDGAGFPTSFWSALRGFSPSS